VRSELVAPDPDNRQQLLVAKVKWRHLAVAERKIVLRQLEIKWSQCSLRAHHRGVRLNVLDARLLGS
jgi:hypothetical protein